MDDTVQNGVPIRSARGALSFVLGSVCVGESTAADSIKRASADS